MNLVLVRVMAMAAVLLAAGCSSVGTKQPFKAKAGFEDQAKLEGVWQVGTGFFFVKFDAQGVGQMRVPGWTTNGEFRVDRAELIPAKSEAGSTFFCIRAQKDGKLPDVWAVAEYVFDDDHLLVWWPEVGVFEAAVTNKVLKGEVKKSRHSSEVTLDVSPADLLEFFDDPNGAKPFSYKSPAIIKRLSEKAELLDK